jgi:beta-glucanase (GH16 family)
MKKLNRCAVSGFLLLTIIIGCSKKSTTPEIVPVPVSQYSFVDVATPATSKPLIGGATNLDKWKLAFSDEFNDNKIDTIKWNIENNIKYRTDITLYANNAQVEETNGNIYLNYSKATAISSNAYYVGRFNSIGKYATKYGFFEARMHVVKPNGHQTAFWMMPNEGTSMTNAGPHEGTANDGAEIDIVEGNKLNTYSLGLHWDGYGVDHKGVGNGGVVATSMHNTEYHIFGLEWAPTYLKYYFNGNVVWQTTDPNAIAHVSEYILFTGSCWGVNTWVNGNILTNTFIQNGGVDKGYIDYVRVYKFNP